MQGRGPPAGNIELYSGAYFGACALGGVIGKSGALEGLQCLYLTLWSTWLTLAPACGPTHTAVTPLDLVRPPCDTWGYMHEHCLCTTEYTS